MKKIFFLFLLLKSTCLFGQNYIGSVKDVNSNEILQYVSIGIVGKDIGTVSDFDGNYSIDIEPEYDNDTLRFSL